LSELITSSNFIIIVDEYIWKLRLNVFERLLNNSAFHIYKVPGEKNNKSLYAAMKIFEFLEEKNISRDSTIVAIGGGVVGDLAGFVASCWYRGVDLIHIPTTLLAAVDSCVGGKTAINFRSTVNAVGTYHHPKAILIDLGLLMHLPLREISSGFGEIIKYSCINISDINNLLDIGNIYDLKYLSKLIELSLKEKEKLVRDDIKESANRLFLNFGHTVGHAIEFSTVYNGKETLRHGEGVALGMLAIFKICIKLGYLVDSDLDKLKLKLLKYNLPVLFNSFDLGASRDSLVARIVELCFKDKKRSKGYLRLILVNERSQPFIYKTADRDLIEFGVREVIK
jgi:3-dehydroquinate synthetase